MDNERLFLIGLKGSRRNLSLLRAELETIASLCRAEWVPMLISSLIEQQILSMHFRTDCLYLAKMFKNHSNWRFFKSELDFFSFLRNNFSVFHINLRKIT